MTMTKSEVPKSVSQYMSAFACKANAKMRGIEMAKTRSQKGVAARLRNMEERNAALEKRCKCDE
jgi:hypothetical protein